jgi:hypothetical protein
MRGLADAIAFSADAVPGDQATIKPSLIAHHDPDQVRPSLDQGSKSTSFIFSPLPDIRKHVR